MEEERIGVIYMITSPTGRIYIGKTINLKGRLTHYKYCNGISRQKIIYNSIQKYGWDNHKFEILEEARIDLLSQLEIDYIEKYNSYHYNNENGMNLTLGGDGTYGRKQTPEEKAKRLKIHLGAKRSDLTKKRMSDAKKGKPSNKLGTKASPETLKKMRECQLGKVKSKESIAKGKQTLLDKLIKNHECILQINPKTNEIVKEWVDLPKNIAIQMKIDDSHLVKCLKNNTKTAGGFIWKFKISVK